MSQRSGCCRCAISWVSCIWLVAIVQTRFRPPRPALRAFGGRTDRAATRAMSPRAIFTADDFGLDMAVNEAVERAHRDGVLTSASLMVTAPAAADAVARAKRMPGLAVGLHLVLVQGVPAIPPDEAAPLLGSNGAFLDSPAEAGLRYFFSPSARRALAAEIRAQFEAFARTGLPLDHVDGHTHLHIHPTIFSLLLEIGRDFGVRAMRVPYENPMASARAAGKGRLRANGR